MNIGDSKFNKENRKQGRKKGERMNKEKETQPQKGSK